MPSISRVEYVFSCKEQTCPRIPVNRCSQPITFRALNRKAHGTHRERKMASQTKQQHDANSAGHTVTDSKKGEGLTIAVLASVVQMNDTARSIKE